MRATRSAKAVLWSAADVGTRQLLQVVTAIMLARLLTPSDFGAVALLSLFLAVATVLSDGGFGLALIQRQDITPTDESTVFWLNLALGLLLSTLIAGLGPLIAKFYDTPVLEPLAAVMGLTVAISSLGAIHQTLLVKALRFRPLLVVSAISTASSGAAAVWMAATGFGIWSLAGQAVIMSVTSTGALWAVHRWRPRRTFSRDSMRRLFGFGGYMLAANLSDAAYTRSYTVFIGRLFGPTEVGYYSRADSTQQIPTGLLSSIVSRVTLPLFSESADNQERLRDGTRLAVRGLMLVNVPLMLGIGALARPLIEVAFGERWIPAAPLLEILALGAVLWPLHVINLHVLLAQGHSRLVWRVEVAKKSIGLLLLAIGAQYGVSAVAWSTVAFGGIAFAINVHYTRRLLDYGAWAQISDFLPALCAAAPVAYAAHVAAGLWQVTTPLVQLVVLAPLGIASVAAILVAFRPRALSDLASALNRQPQVEETTP